MLKYLKKGVKEQDKQKPGGDKPKEKLPQTRSELRRLILRSPQWRGRSVELLAGARWLPDLNASKLVEIAKQLNINVPTGFLKTADAKPASSKAGKAGASSSSAKPTKATGSAASSKGAGTNSSKGAASSSKKASSSKGAGSSKGASSSKGAGSSSKATGSSSKGGASSSKQSGESSKAAASEPAKSPAKRKSSGSRLVPGTYCIGGCGPENAFSNAFVYKILEVFQEKSSDGRTEEVAKCLWFREQQVDAGKADPEPSPGKRKGKRASDDGEDGEDEGEGDGAGDAKKGRKTRTRTLYVADPEVQEEVLDALTEMEGVREGRDEATGLHVATFSRKAFFELLKSLREKDRSKRAKGRG